MYLLFLSGLSNLLTWLLQPDITFFGEDLPDEFGHRLVHHDREYADLVIVIGTSLKVAPVSEVPGILPPNVPQIYISRAVSCFLTSYPSGVWLLTLVILQPVSHVGFDVELIGDCDVVVSELCRRAGWDLKHEMISPDEKVEVTPMEGYESRHIFKKVEA